MSKGRIIVVTTATALLLMFGLLIGCTRDHAMQRAGSFEVGDSQLQQRVLIATQGSPFKDALVKSIVEHLKPRAVYVKVIDVGDLPSVHERQWAAVVVIHTWEFGKPQQDARAFIERTRQANNIVVVTTSGGGRQTMPGIDAISTASVIAELPTPVAELTRRIDALLQAGASH